MSPSPVPQAARSPLLAKPVGLPPTGLFFDTLTGTRFRIARPPIFYHVPKTEAPSACQKPKFLTSHRHLFLNIRDISTHR